MQKYIRFLEDFDKKLEQYFQTQSKHIYCKKGCSYCCEKGDYPISELELKYIMQGYINLDNSTKRLVQENISNMIEGGQCPFLINSECSIYKYRPIICRVHGLAYLYKTNTVKLPFCTTDNLNYKNLYSKNEFLSEPIKENLDTQSVLKDFDYGEIRNLYFWIKNQ